MDPTTANFLSQWDGHVIVQLGAAFTALQVLTLGLVALVKYTYHAVRAS
jgi:hypothetical protein